MTWVNVSIICCISANTDSGKKGNRFDVPSPWVEQEKEVGLHCTSKGSPFEKLLPKILLWHLWNTIDAASNYLHSAFTFKWDAIYRKTSYINHASLSRWPLKCELTCIISNRVENGTGTFVLFIKWMPCHLTWENRQRLGHYGAVSASSHHTLVRQMPPDKGQGSQAWCICKYIGNSATVTKQWSQTLIVLEHGIVTINNNNYNVKRINDKATSAFLLTGMVGPLITWCN